MVSTTCTEHSNICIRSQHRIYTIIFLLGMLERFWKCLQGLQFVAPFSRNLGDSGSPLKFLQYVYNTYIQYLLTAKMILSPRGRVIKGFQVGDHKLKGDAALIYRMIGNKQSKKKSSEKTSFSCEEVDTKMQVNQTAQ